MGCGDEFKGSDAGLKGDLGGDLGAFAPHLRPGFLMGVENVLGDAAGVGVSEFEYGGCGVALPFSDLVEDGGEG